MQAKGRGRGVTSTASSPEQGHLNGSTLRLVSLIPRNKVIDEGENDVEHEDDSWRQQGPQVKGHTLLQSHMTWKVNNRGRGLAQCMSQHTRAHQHELLTGAELHSKEDGHASSKKCQEYKRIGQGADGYDNDPLLRCPLSVSLLLIINGFLQVAEQSAGLPSTRKCRHTRH